MVVLSSCDVGLTDVRPGDETFGMVTALLNAGSAIVASVTSVTRVADDAAMAVMVGFHGRLPSAARRPPAGRCPRCCPAGGSSGRHRVLRTG